MLKSSYEYAYAKYLEYNNVNWKYEEETYNIENLRYTPDFFIYDDNWRLIKIVEVRGGRVKKDIDFAKNLLSNIEKIISVKTEIVLLKDLYRIYEDMPMSINKVTYEWIDSDDTILSGGYEGENNPNYGNKHSDKTKNIIGLKSKERWQDPDYREKMIKTIRKNAKKAASKIRGVQKSPRETRCCLYCGSEFIVTIYSKRRYCKHSCASRDNIKEATNKYVEKRNNVHKEIKSFIIEWVLENVELVMDTPYNRISTDLKELFDIIEEKFEVKDMRVISKAVFGEDKGRKELLKFMKRCIKNK